MEKGPGKADDIREDEQLTSEKRLAMIELAFLVSTYIQDVQMLDGIRSKNDPFGELSRALERMNDFPGDDRAVYIRYRGMTSTSVTEKNDYIVIFGKTSIDTSAANLMLKRMGIRMQHLTRRLSKAFESFSNYGIDTLYIRLPKNRAEFDRMRLSLSVFARFRHALGMDEPITILNREGVEMTFPLIRDENGRYDPNLTILAAINNLNRQTMDTMIADVRNWLDRLDPKIASRFSSVFDALFEIKSLRNKLAKPSIEINNIRWERTDIRPTRAAGAAPAPRGPAVDPATAATVVVEDKPELEAEDPAAAVTVVVVEEDGSITSTPADLANRLYSDADADRTSTQKRLLARLIREKLGKTGTDAQDVLKSIYGKDYKKVGPDLFSRRIHILGEVLDAIEKDPEFAEIEDEILRNVKKRIDMLPEGVIAAFLLQDGVSVVKSGDKLFEIGNLNIKLVRLILLTKRRVVTNKKMHDLVRRDIAFTDGDYQEIARDFDVPVDDAKDLVGMIKSCFDREGHFQRSIFEKNISVFAWYERRIFDFMWHYLKETLHRNDRVAFLNSLQLLIARMRTPKRNAIKTLLTDLLNDPFSIGYSDRNALMLCNLLVRKYNKEINLDIEVTPEEVLLVKEGIDSGLATVVSESIDNIHKSRLMKKIRTMHKRLVESLNPKDADTPPMPVRYLLSLERETFIFLCLVGGETADSIIRAALIKYGNPKSDLWQKELSAEYLIPLLNHLKLVIRCVGRLGTADDLQLLTEVTWGEEGFRRIAQSPKHTEKIMQVMKWIDATRESIVQKGLRDTRDTYGFSVV